MVPLVNGFQVTPKPLSGRVGAVRAATTATRSLAACGELDTAPRAPDRVVGGVEQPFFKSLIHRRPSPGDDSQLGY